MNLWWFNCWHYKKKPESDVPYTARSKLAIVYTRDARNGDVCSIMVMDGLVSGMRTSIASGSGLARETRRTDSSRLNQEREWALGVW